MDESQKIPGIIKLLCNVVKIKIKIIMSEADFIFSDISPMDIHEKINLYRNKDLVNFFMTQWVNWPGRKEIDILDPFVSLIFEINEVDT